MNMSANKYVAYMIMPPRKSGTQILFANQSLSIQEKRVQDFLEHNNDAALLKTFVESGESQRHRHRWPELEAAIEYCLNNQANLIIAEIRNLTHNEAFAKQILTLFNESGELPLDIYCCDQPFIKKDNFAALVKHAEQQKKIHGQLIKAGLSRTSAKSGNPHASDVITKVNKPKIDNAIVFALMLQPVITDYRHRGYSQRRMVTALNEEGFTAPEGGHWVLSQLQKVLDRIKMNESALSLEKRFLEYKGKGLDANGISDALNKLGIASPKGKSWNEDTVEKVSERIKQLHDIIRFNEFVIELMPVLKDYHIDELTEDTFASALQQMGIQIPQHASV